MGRYLMSISEPSDLKTPRFFCSSPSSMKQRLRLVISTPNSLWSSAQSSDKILLWSTCCRLNLPSWVLMPGCSYPLALSLWQLMNSILLSRFTTASRFWRWSYTIFLMGCLRYCAPSLKAWMRTFLSWVNGLYSVSWFYVIQADADRYSRNSFHSMVSLLSISISSKSRVSSQQMMRLSASGEMALRSSHKNFSRFIFLSLSWNYCLMLSMQSLSKDMSRFCISCWQAGLTLSLSFSLRKFRIHSSWISYYIDSLSLQNKVVQRHSKHMRPTDWT